MNPELAEYLASIELKVLNLLQDIRNVRTQLDTLPAPRREAGQTIVGREPTFFDALRAEDRDIGGPGC